MINNNNLVLIELFLFFILKKLHPRISFNGIDFSNNRTYDKINKKKAVDIFKTIQSIYKYA